MPQIYKFFLQNDITFSPLDLASKFAWQRTMLNIGETYTNQFGIHKGWGNLEYKKILWGDK